VNNDCTCWRCVPVTISDERIEKLEGVVELISSDYLKANRDMLNTELEKRIDKLEAKVNSHADGLMAKHDEIRSCEQRIEKLEVMEDGHCKVNWMRFREMNERIEKLEANDHSLDATKLSVMVNEKLRYQGTMIEALMKDRDEAFQRIEQLEAKVIIVASRIDDMQSPSERSINPPKVRCRRCDPSDCTCRG
jgi:uncharacterized protein YdcH (DUF465 family)